MHGQINSDKNEQYITSLSAGGADSRLSTSGFGCWGWELCWMELAEKMQLLSGCTPGSARAGTQQSPQGGCTANNRSVCR